MSISITLPRFFHVFSSVNSTASAEQKVAKYMKTPLTYKACLTHPSMSPLADDEIALAVDSLYFDL